MNEKEKSAIHFLENSIDRYKVFIDTCALLDENAGVFWNHIEPILIEKKKSIIIPYRVYEEVKRFADHLDYCEKRQIDHPLEFHKNAQEVLRKIIFLQKKNCIEIFGDPDDQFADHVFQAIFTRYYLTYNLMLITRDMKLKNAIYRITQNEAMNHQCDIKVVRINKYGYLSVLRPLDEGDFSNFSTELRKQNKTKTTNKSHRSDIKSIHRIPKEERFVLTSELTKVEGVLPLTILPSEGTELLAKREGAVKRVTLGQKIASGGEGTIYQTNLSGIVAKIYKPEKLDRIKYEKLSLMLTKHLECEGVCFPLALLYNKKEEFVGYLMNQARGKELQRTVFIPQLLQKKFPHWTKVDTVTLCITILKKLQYLHERNIILGDINPSNILVVSPTEVYFVDTDSYQIEGYPCPVGTVNFTAPEIQRKEFSTFLRSMGNERFAVATLLFMILLPGKPPYSLQGGESQIDNIINGDFAYASGERSTGKAPEGKWRFCWSHLPRYLKDDFYETFRKDGEHHDENTRYSSSDWLRKMEYYLELLTSGKLTELDAMSIEIMPTRLKKHASVTYIQCRLCGEEVDVERTQKGICQKCLNEGEHYKCARCGCDMVYTNYQKYIKEMPKYEICKECHDHKKEVYQRVRCATCGKVFEITYGEKEFYDKKGYQLPKNCPNCRGHKAVSRAKTSTKRNSGWCFITTAVCDYLGQQDDCYTLSTLRQFRDGWLMHQPEGPALVQEYYEIAPVIVERIEASDEKAYIYRGLWEKYLQPCVALIEKEDYLTCMNLYKKMVLELKRYTAVNE